MKQHVDRRLAALETVWQRSTAITAGDAAFLRWWSKPTSFAALWEHCAARAYERYVAARGHSGEQTGRDPGWYTGLTKDERTARTRFELDELDRLQAELGDEAGWHAWHGQAEAWPQENGAVDAAALDRHLRHTWETADRNRACNPLFGQAWPEWRRPMDAAAHLAFDDLLIADADRVERVLVGV